MLMISDTVALVYVVREILVGSRSDRQITLSFDAKNPGGQPSYCTSAKTKNVQGRTAVAYISRVTKSQIGAANPTQDTNQAATERPDRLPISHREHCLSPLAQEQV